MDRCTGCMHVSDLLLKMVLNTHHCFLPVRTLFQYLSLIYFVMYKTFATCRIQMHVMYSNVIKCIEHRFNKFHRV